MHAKMNKNNMVINKIFITFLREKTIHWNTAYKKIRQQKLIPDITDED